MKREKLLEAISSGHLSDTWSDSSFINMLNSKSSNASFSIIGLNGVDDQDYAYHELRKFVRIKRYGIIELAVLCGETEKELHRALVVPGMTKKDLLSFARLYNQKCVIMKKMDGVYLLNPHSEGPHKFSMESFISSMNDIDDIRTIFSHLYDGVDSVYEREQVSIWREWYISIKHDGDDTQLWKKISEKGEA